MRGQNSGSGCQKTLSGAALLTINKRLILSTLWDFHGSLAGNVGTLSVSELIGNPAHMSGGGGGGVMIG